MEAKPFCKFLRRLELRNHYEGTDFLPCKRCDKYEPGIISWYIRIYKIVSKRDISQEHFSPIQRKITIYVFIPIHEIRRISCPAVLYGA